MYDNTNEIKLGPNEPKSSYPSQNGHCGNLPNGRANPKMSNQK